MLIYQHKSYFRQGQDSHTPKQFNFDLLLVINLFAVLNEMFVLNLIKMTTVMIGNLLLRCLPFEI